jgi:hypothetical protein
MADEFEHESHVFWHSVGVDEHWSAIFRLRDVDDAVADGISGECPPDPLKWG